jgi:phosphinothricin acetyltransferase
VTLPNDASVALHRSFGFEQIGLQKEVGRKFGKFWGVAMFMRST